MNLLKKMLYSFYTLCFLPIPTFSSTLVDPFKNTTLTFDDFKPMLISSSLFITTLGVSCIIKKFINTNLFVSKIKLLNISRETFILGLLYFIWWCIFLSISFLGENATQIMTLQGKWIVLNFSTALIPNIKNCCWIHYLRIPHHIVLDLHKYIGILSFLSILIKIITFTYLYFLPNNQLQVSIMGIITSVFVFLTVLATHKSIKDKYYEVFYYTHKILALLTIISSTFHSVKTLIYITPSLLLYIIDSILRQQHTYRAIYSHLKLAGSEEKNTSCVFIHITLLNDIKVNYGTYFFIKFDDISSIQYHPLSLISKHNENLIFCAKDRGKNTWTNKLKKYDSSQSKNILMNKNMYIQGPYNHMSINFIDDKYKFIYFIAGGIGITTIVSLLQEINDLIVEEKIKNLINIKLFWVAKHFSAVKPFIHLLNSLHSKFSFFLFLSNDSSLISINDRRMKCFNKKIKIQEEITNHYVYDNITNKKDICIISCGPNTLVKDVEYTCNKLEIESYKEIF